MSSTPCVDDSLQAAAIRFGVMALQGFLLVVATGTARQATEVRIAGSLSVVGPTVWIATCNRLFQIEGETND
jgi:hypothetical protein